MRMRAREEEDDFVNMSPLIDCVFLLLIFFLVTSMIKRSERQIPVTLADPTAAVTETAEELALRYGIDTTGQVYTEADRDRFGKIQFAPLDRDLAEHLAGVASQLSTDVGMTERPIELIIERETPFQMVIDTLDLFELQGFDNVRSRVRYGQIGGQD